MKLFGLLLALFATSAFGQGRVFYDNFQGAAPNSSWTAPYYNPCVIVSSAVDGVPAHFGTKQLECNWNGTLSGSNPAARSALVLPLTAYPYNREFFIRFWARYSQDVSPSTGGAIFVINTWDYRDTTVTYNTASYLGISARLDYSPPEIKIFWNTEGVTGDGSVPGGNGPDYYGYWWYYDNHIFVDNLDTGVWTDWCDVRKWSSCWTQHPNPGDRAWHKYEIYLKTNTTGNMDGFARLWFDGTRLIDVENDTTVNPPNGGAYSHAWAPIELMANEAATGANNHVYYGAFEVYTDQGTGGSGSMADATIAQLPVGVP